MHDIRPLNSPTTSKFTHAPRISVLCIHTPPPFQVEMEKTAGIVQTLCFQGAQNIIVSNHKLKSTIECTV